MSKYNYTKGEKEILAVLKDHDERLQAIQAPDTDAVDMAIADSEELLRSIGYQPSAHFVPSTPAIIREPKTIHIPSWEEMVAEATAKYGDVVVEDLFTPEELVSNEKAILLLNQEFNTLYNGKINVKFQPKSPDGYHDALNLVLGGSTAPDIFFIIENDFQHIPTYLKGHNLRLKQ